MRRTPIIATISLISALALLAMLAAVPSLASNHIVPEALSIRSAFTDTVDAKLKVKVEGSGTEVVDIGDPTYTQVWKFTVQPGAVFPWHSHPGTVVVNVTAGALVYVTAEDCEERLYPTGTAFVDPGHGHVHTAYNPGTEPTILIATFYGLPAEGPISEVLPAPAGCVVTP